MECIMNDKLKLNYRIKAKKLIRDQKLNNNWYNIILFMP